ncbi:MAG: hypothetical protein AAGJ79_00270 [Verrucomicrobiota bacterium]
MDKVLEFLGVLLANGGFLFAVYWLAKRFPMRPYRHYAWEVFLMRLLFAVTIYYSLQFMLVGAGESKPPEILKNHMQKHPTGLAWIFDLTWMANEGVADVLRWVLVVALVVYVSGFLLPVSTLAVFLIHNAVFTLNNSQGAIHHGYQIITLPLLAQLVVVWLPWIARLRKKEFTLPEGQHMRDLFVYATQLMIAAAYVLAGVAKTLRSGLHWIADSPYISVQLVKTRGQKFYEYLDPRLADMGMPYAEWMAAHPWLTRGMLTGGLLLELFAFLLLVNRAWALAFGLALILFHKCNEWLMLLHFEQNIDVCMIFLGNVPFWIVAPFIVLLGREPRSLSR